jgi:alkylation response protein AidB-like acyl-CoA dehydrogenase
MILQAGDQEAAARSEALTMNFDLSEDQQRIRESFARLLDEQSSMARVRAALPAGFDQALWAGLAELGAFSLRVPEASGGLGLGVLDAGVLMEEAGRTLASGPVAETLVAARLLATLGGAGNSGLLERVTAGQAVVGIAFHDIADQPVQWIAGGAVAEAVIARDGDEIVLILVPERARKSEPNLASTPIAELRVGGADRSILSAGPGGLKAFLQGIEEWKLLIAAALTGLSREAVRLASAYACERSAFGQPIGTYQAISHPLADLATDIDGARYLVWKTIRDIADGTPDAGAEISMSAWWNADVASRAVAQALHTFGGYGLTTEYDIHLYSLRAKAWPLVFGDPARLLEEAGRRLYAGERTELPDVGEVSIDFDLGEEAHAITRELDAFFEANLTSELKAKAHYSWEGHDPGLHRKLAEARLLFLGWPKELGGREAPPYALYGARNVWEEHGWTTYAASTTAMIGAIMQRFGTEELKREVLSKVAAGEAICSLGFSEPGSGSDVFAAQTRATRDGDGWRIDGQKMFTSGANLADYVLMLTRTDPDAPKHKGLTMFIVPLDAPGVEIQRVDTFGDERTNITYYDAVRVPDSYRLGEVNGGVKVMAASLELEHGGAGFVKTQSHMVRAAETLCREIHHHGRPLIDDPAAQTRLARATAHVALAEVLTYRSLWAGVKKKPNLSQGPMAKLFSTEKFLTDSADLLDLTAPHSLSKRDGPAGFLNQCCRHSQGTTIYAGTSEVHRSLIAERTLGLPRTRG